ncbi:AMP-binding protein, partial [Burkholderia pseudomallei]
HRHTSAQLHDRGATNGARLAAAGVTPGTLLGNFLPRDVRLPAALLASLGSGAVYVPLPEKYPPERRREIIETHGSEHDVTT